MRLGAAPAAVASRPVPPTHRTAADPPPGLPSPRRSKAAGAYIGVCGRRNCRSECGWKGAESVAPPATDASAASHVGRRVSKNFPDHGTFSGEVAASDTASKLYLVTYGDGDSETVELGGVLPHLLQQPTATAAKPSLRSQGQGQRTCEECRYRHLGCQIMPKNKKSEAHHVYKNCKYKPTALARAEGKPDEPPPAPASKKRKAPSKGHQPPPGLPSPRHSKAAGVYFGVCGRRNCRSECGWKEANSVATPAGELPPALASKKRKASSKGHHR